MLPGEMTLFFEIFSSVQQGVNLGLFNVVKCYMFCNEDLHFCSLPSMQLSSYRDGQVMTKNQNKMCRKS